MKKFLSIFAVLMSFFIIVQAQKTGDLPGAIPFDPKVRTGKLANGLTYYIMKNAKPEHRMELRLAVNVGSTQENDDQQGLAHFTEHMAFNGTKNFKKNELVDYIESIGSKFGADLNAYTSFDETVYMLQIPTDSAKIIDKGFQILYDWSCNLTFDSVEIDKERGVVTEEWRLGQGANERMRRVYWPTLFKDSRYAERLPIGKKDILQNCKYETLRSFYREWYRPENMAVIVIGDVDVDKIEAKVKEEFGKVPKKDNVRPLQSFPVPDTKGIMISKATDKEASYTAVQLMYKQPKEIEKTLNDYKNEMVIDVYNSLFAARLREIQQQENAPFAFAGTDYSGLVRTKNVYNSIAVVKDGGIEKGLETLVTENQRVKKYGFTATELDRVKKEVLRKEESQFNEREKTESRNLTRGLVSYFLEQEPDPGIDFEYVFYSKHLPDVTLDEVNALAKKWIHEDDAIVIITAPDKAGSVLPTDEKIKSILTDVLTKDIKPYEDKVITKPLMSEKPTPGKVVGEDKPNPLGIATWKLSNGVTVILKPTDFKNDEILFNSYSFGGTSLCSDADYLSASNAASIFDNSGVGEFSSTELEKIISGKVVGVSPSIGETQQGFNGQCSPKDAETMMQMIYLYFTHPNKNNPDFKAYIEQQRGFLQNRSSSPDAAFQDTVMATMNQYNLRKMPMTEQKLSEIDIEKCYKIYKERFSDANGFTFVFVGNIVPETFKPLVEQYLGSLPSLKKNESYKDLGVVPPKGIVEKTFKRGVEPKSTVAIKLTGPFVYTRKNRNDLNILMQLVSIKLREQLREEKGGVYGVRANPSMEHYPKENYTINIGFGCAPENVDMLIKTAWETIDKIKEIGCDDKDLLKLKETAIRERETALKENRFWLSLIYSNSINKENILEIQDYNNYINNLKPEDLKKLANQYLTKTNMAKFIMNPVK